MKKPMKTSMKKPIKKADGGGVTNYIPKTEYPANTKSSPNSGTVTSSSPSGSSSGSSGARSFPGRGLGIAKAMERASENARFNRPSSGPIGMGRYIPGPTGLKKGGKTPMRKAKGGMAKGKKK